MSKSPLKPWRALPDCETIHALRTAWIGTFQQHLCLHHDKQHFADITNMKYQGLTLQSCSVEQNMDWKHMVLKPLPTPWLPETVRDAAGQWTFLHLCLTGLYYRWCSHGSQEEVGLHHRPGLYCWLGCEKAWKWSARLWPVKLWYCVL